VARLKNIPVLIIIILELNILFMIFMMQITQI